MKNWASKGNFFVLFDTFFKNSISFSTQLRAIIYEFWGKFMFKREEFFLEKHAPFLKIIKTN